MTFYRVMIWCLQEGDKNRILLITNVWLLARGKRYRKTQFVTVTSCLWTTAEKDITNFINLRKKYLLRDGERDLKMSFSFCNSSRRRKYFMSLALVSFFHFEVLSFFQVKNVTNIRCDFNIYEAGLVYQKFKSWFDLNKFQPQRKYFAMQGLQLQNLRCRFRLSQ